MEWVETFARRHFAGDMRRATYCIKDVYLLGRWNLLTETWVPVDYTQMLEDDDNTRLEGTVACAGGKCQMLL